MRGLHSESSATLISCGVSRWFAVLWFINLKNNEKDICFYTTSI